MRLLQAIAGARHGGAEIFFARLVAGLARAGVTQRVLSRADDERSAAFRALGIDPVHLAFGGLLDRATGPRFRREIEDFRPDVVLTWMNRATSFCPRATPAMRFVHVGTPRGYYNAKHYRRCDRLICATEDIAGFYLARGWAAEKVCYIPNYVCPQATAPVAREELDTPRGVPLVLALGRLHENKAFDVLLEAMTRLPRHWLWLAGAGPLERSLKRQAERLGIADRARFLGWRTEAPALLAAADVLACPSRHEPFGNIIIEAWAQGVPVVAAASEGPGRIVTSGVDGVLVPVEDAHALARGIESVTGDADLAGRLVAAGRAAHAAAYSEPVVVGKYVAYLANLAEARTCAG